MIRTVVAVVVGDDDGDDDNNEVMTMIAGWSLLHTDNFLIIISVHIFGGCEVP